MGHIFGTYNVSSVKFYGTIVSTYGGSTRNNYCKILVLCIFLKSGHGYDNCFKEAARVENNILRSTVMQSRTIVAYYNFLV